MARALTGAESCALEGNAVGACARRALISSDSGLMAPSSANMWWPGVADSRKVSTSYAERQNLTIRMSMCRFTRLTNAFSKKFDSHCHALALYFVCYNFCRQHKSLADVSPAMASGLADTLHDMKWIVGLIDAHAPKPGPRGPYKKATK